MTENQNTEQPQVEEPAGGEAVVTVNNKGFLGAVDNYFGITKMKSSFKTEMLAPDHLHDDGVHPHGQCRHVR